MKEWAQAVIGNVRTRLEAWCQSKGRPEWYEIFSAMHFPPPDAGRATQHVLAERLHLSRDRIRYGLEQADRQFVEFLRAEVADQVDSVAEVETEIGELERLLGL